MRTTVTLDSDVESELRRVMAERGVSFKQALNDAIRAGIAPRRARPAPTVAHDMGQPLVNLDKALQLAGELEDEQILRAMRESA